MVYKACKVFSPLPVFFLNLANLGYFILHYINVFTFLVFFFIISSRNCVVDLECFLWLISMMMGTILNISQVFLYSNSITLSEGPVLEEEILFPFSRLCRLDYLEGEVIKFLFFKIFSPFC